MDQGDEVLRDEEAEETEEGATEGTEEGEEAAADDEVSSDSM